MKAFHTVTAIIELSAGLLLALLPAQAIGFLFGVARSTPVETALAQLAGVALLALGVACWLTRRDEQGSAERGMVGGILVYNAGAVTVFVYAALVLGLNGIGLWPAALLHAALAVWCVVLYLKR